MHHDFNAGECLAEDRAAAEARQRDVLAAQERGLGAEDPDTLRTKGNLAITLKERGDLAGAGRAAGSP